MAIKLDEENKVVVYENEPENPRSMFPNINEGAGAEEAVEAAEAAAARAEAAAEQAMSGTPDGYSNLVASIADTFSSGADYKAGDYVLYESSLYRFIANHDAGAWNASDVEGVTVGKELTNLNDDLNTMAIRGMLNGWESTDWTTGYINSSGTVTSNANFRNTDFIPVSAGDAITYKLYGYSNVVWIITAYDNSKARIANDSLIGESSWKTGTYTVAEGTAFVRLSSGNPASAEFSSDDVFPKIIPTKEYVDGIAEEIDTRLDAVESDIPALNDIRADVMSIETGYTRSPNLLDPTKTTPAPGVGAGYVWSDYMPVTAGKTYTLWANGAVYQYYWYNSGKTEISHTAINGAGFEKIAPENAAYARLLYNGNNVTQVMFAEGIVGDYVPYGALVPIDELPDYIVRDTNCVNDPTKYVDHTNVSDSTGEIVGYSSSVSSDYISVEEGVTYYAGGAGDGYWNKTGAAAYNSSKVFVEGISSFPYTVPEGVAYIRVGYSKPGSGSGGVTYTYPCIRKGETGVNGIRKFDTYDTFRQVNSKPTLYEQKNSLYGLKWNAMGDSITEGSGATKNYRTIISERTGVINRNYGVSNTAIAKRGATSTNDMSIRYVDMDDDADIVTVFGGTNDHGNNIPIGQWGDDTVDTVYGAMKILVEGLINKYMGKRIGFITPLPKYNTSNNTDYSYPSASFMPYIECIKDVCKRYSIPVLDLYTESGIAPAMASVRTAMIPDGLHPNAVGHELISWQIQRFLERI